MPGAGSFFFREPGAVTSLYRTESLEPSASGSPFSFLPATSRS